MFDTSFIPVEAASSVNWAKVHSDFSNLRVESTRNQPMTLTPAPLYPIFEVAVWELDALHYLLAALDAHRVALEQRLTIAGESRERAQKELANAEKVLCDARGEFLEAFHQLNQKRETSIQDEEKQIFAAMNALWDLEAVWESHTPRSQRR